jgi:hypothetical protein
MDPLEMDQVAPEVDALLAALDEERFRHVAGLADEPSLARLFAERHGVAHRETVAALKAAGQEALALRVAALRTDRAAVEEEEAWRAADAAARGVGPRGEEPLTALELALPRERDPARRRELARAAAEALGPAASAHEAWAERRARARAEAGLAPDWVIVVAGDQALAASDDAWRDVAAFAVRRVLGAAAREGADLSRADLLHVVSAARWDGLFRHGMLPVGLKLTAEPLGLPLAGIRIDDAPRAGRWPGAHAFGARISLGVRGGAPDWQDLLAATGRAVAAAAQPPRARDPVLAEALGWLLGSLALEPRWLAARADVERRHAQDVVRDLALRRLLALRADAAALRVATEVERGLSGAAWRRAHRDALTAATGAAWEGVRASRDADATRLAAAVRGADEGERLRRALRERFDEDYWRNPRTAEHLAGLLAAGRLPGGDAGGGDGEGAAPAGEAARMLVAKLEGGR